MGNPMIQVEHCPEIDDARTFEVEFNDNSERIDAKILGGEVYSDIAVLTIEAEKANNIVEIGNSKEIKFC